MSRTKPGYLELSREGRKVVAVLHLDQVPAAKLPSQGICATLDVEPRLSGTTLTDVSDWITYEQAAAILGCHFSNVAKLIAKGELASRGKRGGSLNKDEVEALAEHRAERREARGATSPRQYKRVDHRPDLDHEWLSTSQVAQLLGVTKPAVIGRITRHRLPSTRNGGRLWVRRDLLEQVEAARLVRKTRRP